MQVDGCQLKHEDTPSEVEVSWEEARRGDTGADRQAPGGPNRSDDGGEEQKEELEENYHVGSKEQRVVVEGEIVEFSENVEGGRKLKYSGDVQRVNSAEGIKHRLQEAGELEAYLPNNEESQLPEFAKKSYPDDFGFIPRGYSFF